MHLITISSLNAQSKISIQKLRHTKSLIIDLGLDKWMWPFVCAYIFWTRGAEDTIIFIQFLLKY